MSIRLIVFPVHSTVVAALVIGDATLLLELHVVHRGPFATYFLDAVDAACVVKDSFTKRLSFPSRCGAEMPILRMFACFMPVPVTITFLKNFLS